MNRPMADSAITPTLQDASAEPEFRPSGRERLGVALFLFVAVAATAAWVGLIVWGIVMLARHL